MGTRRRTRQKKSISGKLIGLVDVQALMCCSFCLWWGGLGDDQSMRHICMQNVHVTCPWVCGLTGQEIKVQRWKKNRGNKKPWGNLLNSQGFFFFSPSRKCMPWPYCGFIPIYQWLTYCVLSPSIVYHWENIALILNQILITAILWSCWYQW